MGNLSKKLMILVVLAMNGGMAQAAIEQFAGEWHGTPGSAPENVVITFKFETDAAGGIAGFVNMAGASGTGMPVSDITVNNGEISFKFNHDKAEYSGHLDGDRIAGELKQANVTVALNMDRGKYVNPYALNVPQQYQPRLNGDWQGHIKYPDGPMLVLFRFGKNGAGEYLGFTDSPYHSDFNLPITEVSLDGEKLEFKIPRLLLTFKGSLAENNIKGSTTARVRKLFMGNYPATLERGSYEMPDYSCNLPQDVVSQLQGTWDGKLSYPGGSMRNILRFESRPDGKFYCSYDNPDIGLYGNILVVEKWNDQNFTFKTIYPNDAKYKGRVSENKISGRWEKAGQKFSASYEKN